jgi:hypothetical protein
MSVKSVFADSVMLLAMSDIDKYLFDVAQELHKEFEYLCSVVKQERKLHLFPGIRIIEQRLRGAVENPEVDVRTAVEEVIGLWSGLNSGYGSFSDFYVWKEDFDERHIANEELKQHLARMNELMEEF